MKLTKTRVEVLAIPTESNQAFYWDWDGMPSGFGVRVTQNGVRSYILQRRINGKTKRTTLGIHGDITPDQAIIKAAKEMVSFSEGTTSKAVKKRAKTLDISLREVAKDYCANRKTKHGKLTAKTIRDIERHIKANFGDWADKPILKITTEMCRDRFELISKRSESQANQAFRVLRALINFSADDKNPQFNPVETLSRKKLWNKKEAKSGAIPLNKIGAVWNMLQARRTSPALLPIALTGADIIIFIMLTGCRWSEAAELTWNHVNLDAKNWHIPNPKNHKPITLPLSSPALAMLTDRPRVEGNDYVFMGRGKTPFITDARTTMTEVTKLAGLHLTAHDLRRTFIAIGHNLKIELWRLKLLTNHISEGDVTLDHYTETNDMSYLSGEAEQIAAYIVEQGKIATGSNVVNLRGAA